MFKRKVIKIYDINEYKKTKGSFIGKLKSIFFNYKYVKPRKGISFEKMDMILKENYSKTLKKHLNEPTDDFYSTLNKKED